MKTILLLPQFLIVYRVSFFPFHAFVTIVLDEKECNCPSCGLDKVIVELLMNCAGCARSTVCQQESVASK